MRSNPIGNGCRTQVLLDGLTFPEAPRWRGDRLWFSDFYLNRVMTLFLCTSTGSGPAMAEKRDGCIEAVRVDVPGAGLP